MAIVPSRGYAEKFFNEERENVWVYVPAQKDSGDLEIHWLPKPEVMPENTEEFTLDRFVVNFEVTKDDEPLNEFDPRMELRVGLTEAEVKELRAAQEREETLEEKLKLAYCLEDGGNWVVFTDKHKYKIDLDGRDAVVWISDWGDATVGVGR